MRDASAAGVDAMGKITIVGLGLFEGGLTRAGEEALLRPAKVILHTDRCPCARWLSERGIAFESLDGLYESSEDFDQHARLAAEAVLRAAEEGDVVYGVMDVRDHSVGELLSRAPAQVIPGAPAEGALLARAQGQTVLLEASDWEEFDLRPTQNALVREIDSRELASEVKLKLADCYPSEHVVHVSLPDGEIVQTQLYQLDRLGAYDHRTSAFVPACEDLRELERFGFDQLVRLVRRLRGPQGCSWDRSQTHETLRGALLEEAYETADAIDRLDEDALIEELGDVLFGVVLHAEIARSHGEFDLQDVTSAVVEKMIRRHPHVFGEEGAPQKGDWQAIKRQEHGETGRAESMRAVARALPSLMRAAKVLERAENEDELNRLAQDAPVLSNDASQIGRALLGIAARAVLTGVDAEAALAAEIDGYIERFGAEEP